MDRGPAGVDGAGPRTPGVRGSRRLLAAGLAAVVVLLAVIAVLAPRLSGAAPAASAQAATPSPTPTPAAGLTVPGIYQRVAPSVVIIRTRHELGTGVIVADDGGIVVSIAAPDGEDAFAGIGFAVPIGAALGGGGGKGPGEGPQI